MTDAQLSLIVGKAFTRKNQAIDKLGLSETISEFKKAILRNFSFLTIGEVAYAMERGVFGEYGQYYGLSCVTFCAWLQSYSGSQERLDALRIGNVKAIAEHATITDEEKRLIVRNKAIEKFEEYKKTLKLSDIGGWLYRTLVPIIRPSKEEAKAIYDAELDRIMKAKKANTTFADWFKPQNPKELAVANSKLLIVRNFFDKLISNGMEITDYI